MRIRILLCSVIVLCLVGTLHADTTWTGQDGDKWSDPANWSGELPSPTNKAFFQGPGACIVDFADAEAWQIDLAGGPIQIVDGGNLTVTNWFILGYAVGDVGDLAGHLEVYDGGVLNCNIRIFVGFQGEGYLTVYEGGTVNIHTQWLGVGEHVGGTGSGFVELEGGTINILEGSDASGLRNVGNASINFQGGTMTLRDTTENQEYLAGAINDGIIKAYDGVGEVVIGPAETLGMLEVRGVHPLKPSPVDDSLVSGGELELSWTLPDPCVPGQAVPVDVYFTDDFKALEQFTDPEAIRVVSKQSVTSVVVQTKPKTRYYWAVDAYVDSAAEFPVVGPIFSFMADNIPPQVNAGADIVTWLADGVRIGNLDAIVTDDGAISPYTVQWTVISEPNEGAAVIETVGAEDTGITLSALGEYVLQLEASDGEYSGSDTVTINVYSDNCEAAQSLANYEPLVGDLNGDCKVDEADMALLEENWLQDNALTDEWSTVD
jgi:hypothetical protein